MRRVARRRNRCRYKAPSRRRAPRPPTRERSRSATNWRDPTACSARPQELTRKFAHQRLRRAICRSFLHPAALAAIRRSGRNKSGAPDFARPDWWPFCRPLLPSHRISPHAVKIAWRARDLGQAGRGNGIRTNDTEVGISAHPATILLRNDWLSSLIGALLCRLGYGVGPPRNHALPGGLLGGAEVVRRMASHEPQRIP
jgi:hypothetical protein